MSDGTQTKLTIVSENKAKTRAMALLVTTKPNGKRSSVTVHLKKSGSRYVGTRDIAI